MFRKARCGYAARWTTLLFLTMATSVTTTLAQTAPEVPNFVDITHSAGLTVSHISTADKKYMIESMSGGVGFIDCDNDGKLDILLANGSTVDRFKAGGDPMVTLYHQGPGLTFTNITEEAGLTRKGWGMGISVVDFDNDGWQDILVTGFGGSALYRNKGNCKFEDVTAQAGVQEDGFLTGAAWGDYNRDGLVDLFVPRYTHLDARQLASHPPDCTFLGLHVFCGPWGFTGDTDFLFRNLGHGKFEDVSKKAGVSDEHKLNGMQGVWSDFDHDGWPDLYVANDRGANYLYRNKHDGTYEEIAMLAGTALSAEAREQGSMGVASGDLFHDGRFDLFVTNFMQEGDTLYRNLDARGFDDITIASGIEQATFPYVGWGTAFVDFTNRGWDDILIANGHIYPQIDQGHMGFSYREPLLLFHNNGDGTFSDTTRKAGLDALPLESRRGLAIGDINNDGKPDVLLLNIGEPPTLLLNCTPDPGHAVLIQLTGTKSNRSAIGARVTVTAEGLKQVAEVRSGESYMSQNDLRLHFGLRDHTAIESVEIEWPSGAKQVLHGLEADRIYSIEEGSGITSASKLEPSTGCPTHARLPAQPDSKSK